MSAYENAPATRMLATHCCVCRRPLLDAKSVEIGMGPDCRKKHGYDAVFGGLDEQARAAANQLVHQAAVCTDAQLGTCISGLHLLGFTKLASIITHRRVPVQVQLMPTLGGTRLVVRAPFHPAAVLDWQRIPGRRWDGETKTNQVPQDQKDRLWHLLRRWYPGKLIAGPQGISLIPGGRS